MKTRKNNFIKLSDAYKLTHWKQYPKKTQIISSYLESRGGLFDGTIVFGLQYFIKEYLEGPVLEQWMIDEAGAFAAEVFGTDDLFNYEGWQRLLDKHQGRLPVRIMAVPEGTWVDGHNVLIQIENTDEEFPWLTNFLETLLLEVWYPITVATLSFKIKLLIKEFTDKTSDTGITPFHLNDFGFRGVSSPESAGIGGMAHLTQFAGTDTLRGIVFAKEYYAATGLVGASVFATEHSTTTSWGRDHEYDAYEHFLTVCPEGIASLVFDSYNIYKAIEVLGTRLKDKVLARGQKTGFAKTVIRPDSGDPAIMAVECIMGLDKYFGHTVNNKGYKVLNPKVGVIYGDGINYNSIREILEAVERAGYSTDCLVFGMGGALLQQVNRDTLKFAFKCSEAKIDGQWTAVYKDPITDPGKVSKKGRLALIADGTEGKFRTIEVKEGYQNQAHGFTNILQVVFEDGVVIKEYTFDEVKANSLKYVK